MKEKLIIGTRGSRLALWQAHYLQDLLNKNGFDSELEIIKTKGDKIQDLSFDKLEGKGFFTKEIEEALLSGKVDVAVHSLKDMPTEAVEGLVLAGLSYREDPADLLIIKKTSVDVSRQLDLKESAIVGTSSVRRKSQIMDLISDIRIKDLRGNVPTRIRKLEEGDYDAIILASAGIKRLDIDLSHFHTIRLNPKEFVPAPAQGVVVFQTRENDLESRKIIHSIHDKEVAKCSNVERKVMQLMDGGCQVPLGVYCERDKQGNYHAYAAYGKGDGETIKRVRLSQSTGFGLAEKIVEALKEN